MASDGHPPEPGKKGDVATAAAAGPGVNDLDDPQFMCCVCLELLYKPVVISCGHMSCFWCVHKAMHIYQESHCAVCRQPYEHFPSICQLMHHLLLKVEPVDYKRREKEVLEEEKSMQTHSPQIIEFLNSKNNVGNDGENRNEDSKTRPRQEVSLNGSIADEHSKKIKLDDVSCPLCKEMLYQPAVLNCGHVYCVSCLPSLIEEALECHVCGSPHPGDFPNVCLDLDHFLEEYFPSEYESRAQKVQSKKGQCDPAGSSSGKSSEGSSRAQHDEDRFNVHIGVGCDSCGVYPIRGKRYKCQDCTELIGFDLCEACNSLGSKLPPGRFNQQHTPDHRMKLDNSSLYRRLLEEVMIQGGAPPGAIMELFFHNQEIEGGNDEGPVEAVIEELVAPGAMLHVAVDDPEMEGNNEEDHEV